MVGVCESNIIFPCVHRRAICLSCYLLLNHSAEVNQTCYITSPHGKGVQEQHFFSVYPLSVYLSVMLSPPTTTGLIQPNLLPALVAQLDAPSDWRPGGRGFNLRRGQQHSFVEINHEVFSTVILSLPLIQEGQLSVSGERMSTILVNRLED